MHIAIMCAFSGIYITVGRYEDLYLKKAVEENYAPNQCKD